MHQGELCVGIKFEFVNRKSHEFFKFWENSIQMILTSVLFTVVSIHFSGFIFISDFDWIALKMQEYLLLGQTVSLRINRETEAKETKNPFDFSNYPSTEKLVLFIVATCVNNKFYHLLQIICVSLTNRYNLHFCKCTWDEKQFIP